MVLIVEGGITGRPVHHARRLSVHHVSHRRVRTVRPARTCGQWRKHYTLLRLDRCPAIGGEVLEKLVGSQRKSIKRMLKETMHVSLTLREIGIQPAVYLVDSRCHVFVFSLAFSFFLKSDASRCKLSSKCQTKRQVSVKCDSEQRK